MEERKELQEILEKILEGPVKKAVFSDPKGTDYRRIELQRKEQGYQLERFTEKQAFHENFAEQELLHKCLECFELGFRQSNIWSEKNQHSLKLTKKGKVLYRRQKLIDPVKVSAQNNRKKRYLIEEGTVIEPLVDMGVFTKEGKIVQSMYDKYRQINKFLQFIDEAVERSGLEKVNIIDFGCGKSYLTFVVYYYLAFVKKMEIEVVGLDLKADVIQKCNAAAKKYGYDHLRFEVGNIDGYQPDMEIDMVISLHACDTATDFAMFNAISWGAKMIISVPCCQHELCGQLESEELSIFERYGIVKERTAALMTDAIRADLLEYCGYKTQLLEFIDFAHTPKNILVRAVKANISKSHKQKMSREIENLCRCFSLHPTLRELLKEAGRYEAENE